MLQACSMGARTTCMHAAQLFCATIINTQRAAQLSRPTGPFQRVIQKLTEKQAHPFIFKKSHDRPWHSGFRFLSHGWLWAVEL